MLEWPHIICVMLGKGTTVGHEEACTHSNKHVMYLLEGIQRYNGLRSVISCKADGTLPEYMRVTKPY